MEGRSTVPAILVAAAGLLFIGVLVVDSLVTSRELRRAARRLRDIPDHTAN